MDPKVTPGFRPSGGGEVHTLLLLMVGSGAQTHVGWTIARCAAQSTVCCPHCVSRAFITLADTLPFPPVLFAAAGGS